MSVLFLLRVEHYFFVPVMSKRECRELIYTRIGQGPEVFSVFNQFIAVQVLPVGYERLF